MIIGLTGGIASGKSEVCRILKEAGFVHIDADIVAHAVLEDPDVIGEVTSEFGNDILYAEEDRKSRLLIDRKALGKIVFADPEKMDRLEQITHPHVIQAILNEIAAAPEKNYVIEAIALVSSGLIDICDEYWVVHAEPEQQLKRLVENRKMTYEEAVNRIKAQEDHDWDETKADRVIYSTEPVETMALQVKDALKTML